MDNFPLLDIPSANREKIITKLEQTGYFRMQRTCKDMYEFIRTSHNITVAVDRDIHTESDGYHYRTWKENLRINLKDLYGTRLRRFDFLISTHKKFDVLCDELTKNRVQCEFLSTDYDESLNKEECVKLLNILKPEYVMLRSEKSDRYEAVFEAKSLNSVDLCLKEDVVVKTLPRLFATYEHVGIKMEDVEEPKSLVLEMLKIMHSKPFQNLRKFQCNIRGEWKLPDYMELKKKFPGFKWEGIGEDYGMQYVGTRRYLTGAKCEVFFKELISQPSAEIRYMLNPEY